MQPILLGSIAGLSGDGAHERLQIVAFEEGDTTAALAEQQVLVPLTGGDEGLAALGLMHALDQVQFLQFFHGSINCYETQGGVALAGGVIYINGRDGMATMCDRVHDRPASLGEAISVVAELGEP